MRIRVTRGSVLLSVILLFLCSTIATTSSAQTYTVKLAWDKVNFEELADLVHGYKIYYKTGLYAGPPYNGAGFNEGDSPIYVPANNLPNPDSPEYTITGLNRSTIYYFAVTTYVVTPTGYEYESGYSNEVDVLIDKNTMGGTGTFKQLMQPEYFRVGDINK